MEKLSYEHLANKTVPVHKASWIYLLGGLTGFAFVVQIVTGILLMLYYQPTVLGAYDSVRYIVQFVPGGSLIRNMHVWSSSAMVVFLFLHATTNAFVRAYRKPRELTWVTGALSMFVVLGLAFSGYLLPWNNLAVYATKVGLQIAEMSTSFLPGPLAGIGGQAAAVLAGPDGIGQETLNRFFALHIWVLPALLIALVSVHLLLVQIHGMSVPRFAENSHKQEKFFFNFALKDLSAWMIYLTLLVALAVVLPYDYFQPYTLLKRYNPIAAAPIGIKPEWYFYFLYYPLEFLPKTLVILGTMIFFGGVVAAPWAMEYLPKVWGKRGEESKFPLVVTCVVALAIVTLTLFGQNIVDVMRGTGAP